MQFGIKNRENIMNGNADILNKHVLQLHKNTRVEKREIEEFRRQLEHRD